MFRIWAWGSNAGTFRPRDALTRFLKDGRDDHFLDLEEASNIGFYWPDHAGYGKLFEEMVAKTDAYESGLLSAGQAADDLYEVLTEADYMPKHFGFAERDQRFLNPTPRTLLRTARWARKEADRVVRQLMLTNFGEAVRHKVRGRRIF